MLTLTLKVGTEKTWLHSRSFSLIRINYWQCLPLRSSDIRSLDFNLPFVKVILTVKFQNKAYANVFGQKHDRYMCTACTQCNHTNGNGKVRHGCTINQIGKTKAFCLEITNNMSARWSRQLFSVECFSQADPSLLREPVYLR